MDAISKEPIHFSTRAQPQPRDQRGNERENEQEEEYDLPESFTRELNFVKKLQGQTITGDGNDDNDDDDDDDRALSVVYFEEWFSGQNFAAIVMNYCDGGTLAQEIDAKSNFEHERGVSQHATAATATATVPPYYSERRVAWYALQLSEALAYAHERGVYHHDVKSSNILIDWTAGGKLLLADFGSAIEKGEESFGFSELYASPELQAAFAESRAEVGTGTGAAAVGDADAKGDADAAVLVDGDKVDSFGLGCILLELLCCKRLVDLSDERTLAEIIVSEQGGVEDALDRLECCLKLPWLCPANQTKNSTNESAGTGADDAPEEDQKIPSSADAGETIGYSFQLKSLLKTLLEPNPNNRWSAIELQNPLRNDASSPLLANFLVASHPPVAGEPVTIDNVQLGLFVQRGPDHSENATPIDTKRNAPFDVQYKASPRDEHVGGSLQSISAMSEFSHFSFEELRLHHYAQMSHKKSERSLISAEDIGVVVKLDPDGLYAEVVFPSSSSASSNITRSTYRIGAARKFELQVSPPLPDYFVDPTCTKKIHTGLISATTLTRLMNKAKVEDLIVGENLADKCLLAAIDVSWDIAIVVPKEKMCGPTSEQLSFRAPSNTFSLVGPRKVQSQPSHWVPNGGILVEEENLSQRDAVTELFYSDRGGMDIQKYEIISIKRVQSIELWKSYSEVRSDIAASNWGVCNEQRLFLGTAGRDPKELLEDPPTLFYPFFHSDGVTFTNIPSQAHRKCFHRKGSNLHNHKEIILSRVTLGRIKFTGSTLYSSLSSHSIRKLSGGSFSISNTVQAYPEYIISYKQLYTPSTRGSRNPPGHSFGTINFSSHSSAASEFSFSGVNGSRTASFNFNYSTPPAPTGGMPYPSTTQPTTSSLLTPTTQTAPHEIPGMSYPSTPQPAAFSFGHYPSTSQTTATSNFGSIQSPIPDPTRGISFLSTSQPTATSVFGSTAQTSVPMPMPNHFSSRNSPRPQRSTSSQQNKVHAASNSARASSSERVVNVRGHGAPNDVATHRKVSSAEANNGGKLKSSTKQCVVCLERDVRRICLPCGHPCLCEVCSTDQGLRKLRRKCPECRGTIKQVVTIFARVVDD